MSFDSRYQTCGPTCRGCPGALELGLIQCVSCISPSTHLSVVMSSTCLGSYVCLMDANMHLHAYFLHKQLTTLYIDNDIFLINSLFDSSSCKCAYLTPVKLHRLGACFVDTRACDMEHACVDSRGETPRGRKEGNIIRTGAGGATTLREGGRVSPSRHKLALLGKIKTL